MNHTVAPPVVSADHSISVVESDARLLAGLAGLFNRLPGFRCASLHVLAELALSEIPRVNPAAVLVNLQLADCGAVELVRRLRPRLLPEVHIITYSVYWNLERTFEALAAGATGYLPAQLPGVEWLHELRAILAGNLPMSSEIARKILQVLRSQPDQRCNLSVEEIQLLEKLTKGYSFAEVATLLRWAEPLVQLRVQSIYEKIQAHAVMDQQPPAVEGFGLPPDVMPRPFAVARP